MNQNTWSVVLSPLAALALWLLLAGCGGRLGSAQREEKQ